jgi:hypothetical protein
MPRTLPSFQHAAVFLKTHTFFPWGILDVRQYFVIWDCQNEDFSLEYVLKNIPIKKKTYWIWYKRVNLQLDEKERTKGSVQITTTHYEVSLAPSTPSKAFVCDVDRVWQPNHYINVELCQKLKIANSTFHEM